MASFSVQIIFNILRETLCLVKLFYSSLLFPNLYSYDFFLEMYYIGVNGLYSGLTLMKSRFKCELGWLNYTFE